jgi:hypothetical protein
MCRQEARHLGEDRQQRGRRSSPGEQRTAEFPEEEDQRHLARLIGELPVPRTIGIGAAKGALHLSAQAQRVDPETLRQIRLQRFGHAQDCSGRIEGRDRGDRRKGALGRKGGEMGHRETPE